jgi:hypothetical protein
MRLHDRASAPFCTAWWRAPRAQFWQLRRHLACKAHEGRGARLAASVIGGLDRPLVTDVPLAMGPSTCSGRSPDSAPTRARRIIGGFRRDHRRAVALSLLPGGRQWMQEDALKRSPARCLEQGICAGPENSGIRSRRVDVVRQSRSTDEASHASPTLKILTAALRLIST